MFKHNYISELKMYHILLKPFLNCIIKNSTICQVLNEIFNWDAIIGTIQNFLKYLIDHKTLNYIHIYNNFSITALDIHTETHSDLHHHITNASFPIYD